MLILKKRVAKFYNKSITRKNTENIADIFFESAVVQRFTIMREWFRR